MACAAPNPVGLTAAAGSPADLDAMLAVWPQLLIVIGVVGMGVLLTMSIRGKIARRNADRPSPREQIDQAKALVASRFADDHRATEQSIDAARRLAVGLDNKADRLEQLLDEAEQRIAELEAMLDPDDGAESEGDVAGRIGAGHDDQPSPRPVLAVAAAHESTQATGQPAATAGGSRALDPLTRRVYDLADAGRTNPQIARELNEQIGKVELILALRRQ